MLDVRLPGLSGPELQCLLSDRGVALPVVFLTGHGDVPTSVRAMQRGAVDFLSKPVDQEALLGAVRAALQRHAVERARQRQRHGVCARIQRLSGREREFLGHVIRGRLNEQIALDLGISEKTVKVHRPRAMEKMEVRSVAELIQLCGAAGALAP